jgi:hypothetical protein
MKSKSKESRNSRSRARLRLVLPQRRNRQTKMLPNEMVQVDPALSGILQARYERLA